MGRKLGSFIGFVHDSEESLRYRQLEGAFVPLTELFDVTVLILASISTLGYFTYFNA
jgi:hypothetical protein